jgi:predicted nuclease with RNAse H fold
VIFPSNKAPFLPIRSYRDRQFPRKGKALAQLFKERGVKVVGKLEAAIVSVTLLTSPLNYRITDPELGNADEIYALAGLIFFQNL